MFFSSASKTPCRLEGRRTWPNLRGNGTLLPPVTDLVNFEILSKFGFWRFIKDIWYFLPGWKILFSELRLGEARKKWWNLFFERIFGEQADCVFCYVHYEILAVFDTLQLMHTKPFVYSDGNQIFMVFTSGEPITFEIGACRFIFPLYCIDRLKFQLSFATSE